MKYTLTNQTGYPTDLIQFADETAQPNTALFPVYEFGDPFSFEFKVYEYDPLADADVQCPIELLSYSSVEGFSATQLDDMTIKISGVVKDAFNSFYKFLTNEDEVKILPSTTKDYKSLVEWSPPSDSVTNITHKIKVMVDASVIPGLVEEEQLFNVPQEVHWKWQPALKRFQELVAGSKV